MQSDFACRSSRGLASELAGWLASEKLAFNSPSDRQMPDTNTAATVPPEGTVVEIHGLVAKPELNGETATVIGKPTENGRLPVQVMTSAAKDGINLALKHCNYTIVTAKQPPNPAPPVPSPPPPDPTPAGYPDEQLKRVFDAEVQRELAPPRKKELHKFQKALPLGLRLFDDVANAQRVRTSTAGSRTTVDEETFKTNLETFTWGLLSDFDETLWSNVLVAGGAVLASLMPPEGNYKNLKPLAGNGGSSWCEFDLYHNRRRGIGNEEPTRTMAQYLRETRWPTADIDLFVYGLDEPSASLKLLAILTTIQRTIIRKHGVGNDVCFIKTQNTITVGCGVIGRTAQVILRLYESKSAVLNGFDIDCCCVGYDGRDALITPRCITAMSTKLNMINLQIRGEAYECRLLKYVERGFAIGLPLLDNSRRDREHLAFKLEKSTWSPEDYELSGDSWSRWTKSKGLERLLMAENIARLQNGVIERGFPGRQRSGTGFERTLKMDLQPYPRGIGPVRDTYTSHDKAGNPIWPATTKLDAIKRGEHPFQVKWYEGNMPRKPMEWEEWAASAYLPKEGAPPRKEPWRYDPAKAKKEREEREAKEKAKREADIEAARVEGAAEAAAEAERAKQETLSLRKAAAETEAELKKAKREEEAKARLAAAEKNRVQAQLAKAREANERLEEQRDAEKANLEMQLQREREAKERLEEESEDKLCCVCSDAKKTIMFVPCRHVSTCAACSPKVSTCPLCREVPSAKVPVYL